MTAKAAISSRTDAGRIWGIDHGLCFHVENKLRTVMWDFAGEELPREVLSACESVVEAVPGKVAALLEADESQALRRRAVIDAAKAPVPCSAGGLPGLSLAARVAGSTNPRRYRTILRN